MEELLGWWAEPLVALRSLVGNVPQNTNQNRSAVIIVALKVKKIEMQFAVTIFFDKFIIAQLVTMSFQLGETAVHRSVLKIITLPLTINQLSWWTN